MPNTNIDGLEKLFKSKSVDDVFKFYSFFDSAKELVDYSEKRPRGKARMYEIDGDKMIIVVAPTKDHNGRFAKGLAEIFKGFHLIFVESGNDPYFNYARNTNLGITQANRYKPEWIIVTNDDMYRIDDPKILREELMRLDNKRIDNVWISPEPEHHHSRSVSLLRILPALRIARRLQSGYNARMQDTLNRYGVEYVLLYGPMRWYYRPFAKEVMRFIDTEDFFVLSGHFVSELYKRHERIYDEIFINGAEDAWLSLKLQERSAHVDFRIGSMIGGTHGLSRSMDARGIIAKILFDYKIREAGII